MDAGDREGGAQRRARPLLVALVAASFLAACGGTTVDSSGGDAGTDAAGKDGGASTIACNGATCGAGQVCVVTTSGGGPCQLPDDAGVCPNGSHTTGCCDNTTTSYACKALPGACKAALACPCADTLCQCGGCDIADAGVLACQCLYP